MATPVPPIRLELLNLALRTLGKDPVTAYSASPSGVDQKHIVQWIEWASREIQTVYDWKFNYAEKVAFTSQPSGPHQGHVILHPVNAQGGGAFPNNYNIARISRNVQNLPIPLSTTFPDIHERLDLITDASNPQWKVFDLVNQSYNFGVAFTIYLNVNYMLDLDITPPSFKEYIAYRAAAETAASRQADEATVRRAEGKERLAWHRLCQDHLRRSGTIYTSTNRMWPTMLGNYDAGRAFMGLKPPFLAQQQ